MGKGIKFYNSDEEDEKDDRQKSNHGADVVVKKYDTWFCWFSKIFLVQICPVALNVINVTNWFTSVVQRDRKDQELAKY